MADDQDKKKKSADAARAAGLAKKKAKAEAAAAASTDAGAAEADAKSEPAPKPRLIAHYREKVVPALQQQFGYKNLFAVPKLEKIVISMGLGKAVTAGEK